MVEEKEDFKVLAEVIRKLTKLRYLNLSGCMQMMSEADIQVFLVGISTIYNLEHLDLSQNEQLNSIPETIGNFANLHTLDITYCNIQKLPAWIAKVASLKIVNMTTLDVCVSDFILFAAANPSDLKIRKLEDVKSLEEAQSIKLIEKPRMNDLQLEWTLDCDTRFVDDKDVLEKLVPPNTIKYLAIKGYMSLSFPTNWLMDSGQYLPNVVSIDLTDLLRCNNLGPLGQLPKLETLLLCGLDSLEELNTEGSCGELMFPMLLSLHIWSCPKLRIKPCLPKALSTLSISSSDNMLTSWGECVSQTSSSSSSSVLTNLKVERSKVPLYQWRLLQQIFALPKLIVRGCSDLATCSPEVIQCLSSLESLELIDDVLTELPTWLLELTTLKRLSITLPKLEVLNDNTRQLRPGLRSLTLRGCISMVSLPQWLGELTSLEELKITECKGICSLPGCIRQLTKLKTLEFECYDIGYPEIGKMLSSISADTDEVDIDELRKCYRRTILKEEFLAYSEGSESDTEKEDISESTDYEDSTEEDIEVHEEDINNHVADSEEDSFEFFDSEEDIEEHEEGIEEQDLDIEQHDEDVNNNLTSADAHVEPGVDMAVVVDSNVAALNRSLCAAVSIESGSAAKNLSDPLADAINISTQENVTHKRRVASKGSADPIIVEAPARAEKRQCRLLVPAVTTSSQDTSSGSRINYSGTSPDALIMPTDVFPDAAATDIVPSLLSLGNDPDSDPWWSCYFS